MNRPETIAFNKDFLSAFKGWHSRIEFAPGGTAGNADALVLVLGMVLPVEVKIAKLTRKGYVATVRPSQVRWHRSLADAGGVSVFFFKSLDGKFWVMSGSYVASEIVLDPRSSLKLSDLQEQIEWLAWLAFPELKLNIRRAA